MAKDNYPGSPTLSLNATDSGESLNTINLSSGSPVIGIFPNDRERIRLDNYEYYRKLFLGQHFEAFRLRIDDEKYNRAYARLRYIAVNFAGLLSKIMADMLFSEPITVKMPEGDQDWVDAFWRVNKMDVQLYESALGNSYQGDALFKLRAGKLYDTDKTTTVICEDISPRIYFPELDDFNIRSNPKEVELKWTFEYQNNTYLRVEEHYPQRIENKVYLMKGDKIQTKVDPKLAGLDLQPAEQTKVDNLLITHIPNWKTGDRYFGLSDYHDLDTLFYALNNRISKVDNILDKHGDPILMVPPGVIDDKGNVNKKALGVIEVSEGESNKPQYIVWDASLQSAFTEVEKLVDFLYLTSEISPDLLGLGEGKSESGRALKFKLMRTLAKTQRKRLYYDQAIKEIVYNAQVFAKANNLTVDGLRLKGEPTKPEIDWQDGLPIDNAELQEQLILAVDAGLKSKLEAIMELEQVDEKSAQKMLDEVEKEKPKVEMPMMKLGQNEQVVDPKTGKPPMPFAKNNAQADNVK